MKLFLDDIRDPPDATWIVVRSYADATQAVERYGFPDVVSFDHDLGDGLSGYDFAHFLVERDLDSACMPINFTFIVHSANPVGHQNIVGLLRRYLQHKSENCATNAVYE